MHTLRGIPAGAPNRPLETDAGRFFCGSWPSGSAALSEAWPHRKHDLNLGPAPPSAGLPSPSSLRDATSPKVRGFGCTGKLLFSKSSPFGGAGAKRLRGRGCGQEAAHLVWHCLAEAWPHRKHDLNLGSAPPSAGLPSPSSLRDATSPKVRGFGYPGKFAFSKKLPLWGSWTPLGGLRGQARCRGSSAPVSHSVRWAKIGQKQRKIKRSLDEIIIRSNTHDRL